MIFRFIICVFLVLFSLSSFGQKEKDTVDYEFGEVVMGIGPAFNSVGTQFCLGGELDVQFRFNVFTRAFFNFETMFSLNKRRFPTQSIDFFTGDTTDTEVGLRFHCLTWKLEFDRYLNNMFHKRLAFRVGANAGIAMQMQSSDWFSTDQLVTASYDDSEKVGFICGGLFGMDLSFKRVIWYIEIGANYHYVNPNIVVFDSPHQIGFATRIGVSWDIESHWVRESIIQGLRGGPPVYY